MPGCACVLCLRALLAQAAQPPVAFFLGLRKGLFLTGGLAAGKENLRKRTSQIPYFLHSDPCTLAPTTTFLETDCLLATEMFRNLPQITQRAGGEGEFLIPGFLLQRPVLLTQDTILPLLLFISACFLMDPQRPPRTHVTRNTQGRAP